MTTAVELPGRDLNSPGPKPGVEPSGGAASPAAAGDALFDHLLSALRLVPGKHQVRSVPHRAPELVIELDPALCERLEAALRAEHDAASVATDQGTPGPIPKSIVLVADDSPIERRCLRAILARDARIESVEAEDGLAAWELLDGGLEPTLCIFDIMMPRMNGLEVVERMRKDSRFDKTPVVLCTAVKDRETVIRAAPLHVSYYLVKPYSSADILAQVEKVLGKPVSA